MLLLLWLSLCNTSLLAAVPFYADRGGVFDKGHQSVLGAGRLRHVISYITQSLGDTKAPFAPCTAAVCTFNHLKLTPGQVSVCC